MADTLPVSNVSPPAQNPAITRCLEAFRTAHDAAKKQDKGNYDCICAGCIAYRSVMPPLDSHENIRNFIACVTYGMILDSLSFRDSQQLLYAAQTAISAIRAEPKPPGRPKSSNTEAA